MDCGKVFNWGLRVLGDHTSSYHYMQVELKGVSWEFLGTTQIPAPLTPTLQMKAVFSSNGERIQGALGLKGLCRTLLPGQSGRGLGLGYSAAKELDARGRRPPSVRRTAAEA